MKSCKVIDYTPEWVRREEEKKKGVPPVSTPASQKEVPPPPSPEEPMPTAEHHAQELPDYDLPDMKQEGAGGLGMVEIKAVRDSGDEDDDSPPGR